MSKKHYTKQELLEICNRVADTKHKQLSAPFTAMAITCNHILWNKYDFRHERLSKFNIAVGEYLSKLDNGEITEQELQDRLFEKSDFNVEYVPHEEKDIKIDKKKKILYDLAKKEMQAENEMVRYSTTYILVVMNYMIDLKFGKKRLEKLKDEILDYFDKINSHEIRLSDTNASLIANGIIIEMPTQRI